MFSFVNTAAPSGVQNVRVFIFFPHRGNTMAVSGQVVWDRLSQEDAGGTVDMYQIMLRDGNNESPAGVSHNYNVKFLSGCVSNF